jgi:hypothetical protein
VYVERLRLALENSFREAGGLVDADAVILSQVTVMNEVGYRLKASIEWRHIDV